MVNYVISFCKITGASKIFKRNFYLPLLKPQTPKEALRTFRITGKWLMGAKIQHYIPVLLNHKKKRARGEKNYGKIRHTESEYYTYMAPVLDADNEHHKNLLAILETKNGDGDYVYTVEDKKYNIVLQSALEHAIRDGDVIDVLVSQNTDKIIVKLKNFKKIPIEIDYFDSDSSKLLMGEGATSVEEEKFHHHGKYTMSLAKIFEDKEMMEERWEEELQKLLRKRRRQKKEGSKEWKEMMQETMKNFDWTKFEEDARQVIEEIDESPAEEEISMDIEDLDATLKVNEKIKTSEDLMNKLPTMLEIPDLIRNMESAQLQEINVKTDDIEEPSKVSGVKVVLSSGKECFVSGQMVRTDEGDVFVPGQTIENDYGVEYTPGITINVNDEPTLINGLIMGDEAQEPMFLPTQSTITADGQLTFVTDPEERPKMSSEKKERTKEQQPIEEDFKESDESFMVVFEIDDSSSDDEESVELSSSVELDSSEIDELKSEQQRLELEKLKAILMDDGMNDVLANLEEKKSQLQQRLDEIRRLSNLNPTQSLVSYVNEDDALEIASRIFPEKNESNSRVRLSDILLVITRRAANFLDKNNVRPENITQNSIPIPNANEIDQKFANKTDKLKVLLKTSFVSVNDVYRTRPKDQKLALHSLGDIILDVLHKDRKILNELLDLMSVERERVCDAIFKQLTQNLDDCNINILAKFSKHNLKLNLYDALEMLQKILSQNEVVFTAYEKLLKLTPELLDYLQENVAEEFCSVKNEDDAVNVLVYAIRKSVQQILCDKFQELPKKELSQLEDEAKSLGVALDCVNGDNSVSEEVVQRVLLLRLLSERDFTLKCALKRLERNPVRARTDPRIRQLVRESGMLDARHKRSVLQNSREISTNWMRDGNVLAVEDFLVRRKKNVDLPLLVSRSVYEMVVPKEAESGVRAGRVPYRLVDEEGVTNFRPLIHIYDAKNNGKNKSSVTERKSSTSVKCV